MHVRAHFSPESEMEWTRARAWFYACTLLNARIFYVFALLRVCVHMKYRRFYAFFPQRRRRYRCNNFGWRCRCNVKVCGHSSKWHMCFCEWHRRIVQKPQVPSSWPFPVILFRSFCSFSHGLDKWGENQVLSMLTHVREVNVFFSNR